MSAQTAAAMAWRVSAGRGVLVLPAVLGPQLLGRGGVARRSRPSASRSAGSTWRRLTVSRAEGIGPSVASRSMWSASAAGADRLGLAGVAQHPERPARAGGDRGQDRLDLARWASGRPRPGPPPCPPPAARRSGRGAAGRSCGRPGRRRPARPPPWPWWPPPPPAGRRRPRPGRRCAAWSSCRTRPGPAPPAGAALPGKTRTAATWSSPSPGAAARAASTVAVAD